MIAFSLIFTLSPRRPGGEGRVRGASKVVGGAAHLTFPGAVAPGPLPLPPKGRRGAFFTDAGGTAAVRVILCALVLSLALTACGKRNAPQPPPDVPDTYPRPYPSE